MLEELLGTKLRALYQRSKGRDMYDLYKAMTGIKIDTDKLIQCYNEYMKFAVDKPPTQRQFLLNIEEKLYDSEFLGDTKALFRTDEEYNPHVAWELIKKELILKI